MAANPGARIPRARAIPDGFPIAIDTRERKTLENLAASLSDGTLAFQMQRLAETPVRAELTRALSARAGVGVRSGRQVLDEHESIDCSTEPFRASWTRLWTNPPRENRTTRADETSTPAWASAGSLCSSRSSSTSRGIAPRRHRHLPTTVTLVPRAPTTSISSVDRTFLLRRSWRARPHHGPTTSVARP